MKHYAASEQKPREGLRRKINLMTKSIERAPHTKLYGKYERAYEDTPEFNLLNKWENEYGGRENRQFHIDQKALQNNWDYKALHMNLKDEGKTLDSSNDVKPSVAKEKEDEGSDFEYDWDGDHHNGVSVRRGPKVKIGL